jgi:DNA-binding transcriptional LysR family regulator
VATNGLSNLLLREADIALRMVEPAQQTTIAKRVGSVRLGAFASQSYLAQHPLTDAAHALAAHRFITDGDTGEVARGFAALGLSLPVQRVSFASTDLLAQWGAIRAGLGIGFVAHYLARTDAAVVQVLPELAIAGLPMWLVSHREVRTDLRVRAVFDWLSSALPHALAT